MNKIITSRLIIFFCYFIYLPFGATQTSPNFIIDSLETQVELSRKSGDGLAVALLRLGNQNIMQEEYSAAIPILEEAFEVGQTTGDSVTWVTALGSRGYAHNMRGENQLAFQYFLKGMNAADSLKMKVVQARFLFFIGDYFRLQEQLEPAKEYLEKAGALYEELEMKGSWCRNYFFSLSALYQQMLTKEGDQKAMEIFQIMLSDECKAAINESERARIYNSLGELYTTAKKYELAESYILKALKQFRKDNAPSTLVNALNNLALLNKNQGKLAAAKTYIAEAYKIAKEGEDVYALLNAAHFSGIINHELGDHKKAAEDLIFANSVRDSVEILKRIGVIAELELEYKTNQKDQELANQTFQLKNQELALEVQRNRFQSLLGWGSFTLTLLGGYFIWNRNKLKNKEKEAKILKDLDQSKTKYFTNISHELRTPLSLIIDPLKRLATINNNPEEAPLISTANKNAQRMLQLVNQMLDLSKLDAGKQSLKAKQGDVNLALKGILDSFRLEAKERKIALHFNANQEEINLYYDEDKLEKIIFNLLGNAFKFTPDGGVISVVAFQQDHQIEITVKDTGPGIQADKIPFIFDRFYQVDDSETRAYQGSGIGLTLAKELVELHHGKISVESKEGVGTSMIIHLPMGHAHLQPSEIISASKENISMFPSKKPIHQIGDAIITSQHSESSSPVTDKATEKPILLIIEDHPDLRKYIVQQLQINYQVLEAKNGLEGIEMAYESIPDLIISDIMMPGMDGYGVCQQLKKDERSSHIPIILLTAKATAEDKLKGLEFKADDYITKPFDSQELQVRIKNLIEQRKTLKSKFSSNLMKIPNDIIVNSIDQNFMEEIKKIIEINLSDENFGVEELGRAIGMSRSQLHRKLKALTGLSTSIFLRSFRLQRAYQLLEQAAGNATEIAFKVGFSNSNYFFKCFKEEFSITPGQLLKTKKQEKY